MESGNKNDTDFTRLKCDKSMCSLNIEPDLYNKCSIKLGNYYDVYFKDDLSLSFFKQVIQLYLFIYWLIKYVLPSTEIRTETPKWIRNILCL